MSDQIRLHIDESKAQAQRLEEILHSLGTSHSTFKDLVTSFTGNVAALAHAPMQDEVMKNTFANFAFEHFEIAAYRSLLTMAELAGDDSGPRLLQQSLGEEIRMAKWIEDNLERPRGSTCSSSRRPEGRRLTRAGAVAFPRRGGHGPLADRMAVVIAFDNTYARLPERFYARLPRRRWPRRG